MTEPSKEEMLKEIVQKMVDKGWKPSEEYLKKSYKEKLGDYIIEINHNSIKIKICTARVLEQINRYGDDKSVPLYDELFNGALPNLLGNEGAMKALVGDGLLCNVCGWSRTSMYVRECCADKSKSKFTPAYIYHPMHALKLILTPDGDAINYLWEEMKR